MQSIGWSKKQILDELDRWMMDFDVNVDAHFKAGDAENGTTAFEAWHAAVYYWLNEINSATADEFIRTARTIRIKPDPRDTIRSKFLRSRGGRPILYLKKLQKGFVTGAIVLEDLRVPPSGYIDAGDAQRAA